jgi:geranylgeranyl diphosphate synthase type I
MSADYGAYLGAVEEEMRQLLSAPDERLRTLYAMMAYHLGWVDARGQPVQTDSGKRVRPLLCLLCCEAEGGDWRTALPAATSLELIHNFSLIHDDIEDNSPTRRGRSTVWAVWGLAHSTNVGDTMLMLARLALGRLASQGVDPSVTLQAMDILDRTCLQLCQGQYLDIAGEGRLDTSEEAYLEMIAGKTAALLAASTQVGALIGRSSPRAGTPPRADEDRAGAQPVLDLYRQFGWHLGLAFQMVDDLLGIWGDRAITGKSAADDLRSRKMTLPVIFALRTGPRREQLAALYRQDALGDQDIARAVAILDEARARHYVQQLAAHHAASAMAALNAAAPQEPAAAQLRELSASLTGRQK